MEAAEFSVTPALRDGCRVLVLEGELCMATAATLDEALEACTDGLPVIVDLSMLRFIESSGVQVLLRERKVGRRPSAIVRTPGSNVARVLDIVGAKKLIPISDDVAQAVAQLGSQS